MSGSNEGSTGRGSGSKEHLRGRDHSLKTHPTDSESRGSNSDRQWFWFEMSQKTGATAESLIRQSGRRGALNSLNVRNQAQSQSLTPCL